MYRGKLPKLEPKEMCLVNCSFMPRFTISNVIPIRPYAMIDGHNFRWPACEMKLMHELGKGDERD